MTYQRNPVKAPRLSGLALKALVNTMESGLGSVVLDKLVKDSGIDAWRELSPGDAPPLQCPLPPGAPAAEPQPASEQAARAIAASPPHPERESVAAYLRAYREGGLEPVTVVQRLHEAIAKLDSGKERLGLFVARKPEEVQRAAEASGERLRSGKPLSVLDGIPVVLKDEVDLAGFPTTLGTKLPHPCGHRGLDRGRAPQGRRRRHPRQGQHERDWHQPHRVESAPRRRTQPVEPGPHDGRQLERLGRRRGRGPVPLEHRRGWRWLHPHPRGPVRHRWPQGHLGPHPRDGRPPVVLERRACGAHGPHRR